MSWQVPIYSKDPEDGTITYLQDETTLKTAEGFFSFSYYNHDKIMGQRWQNKGTSLYIWGLFLYTKVLEAERFRTWKMIIYTDQYTLEKLRATTDEENDFPRIQALFTNPNVVFAIVNWDRHTRSTNKINGGALRMFRSRAPFDFPDKLICMRDADTFFDNTVTKLRARGRFRSDDDFNRFLVMMILHFKEWEEGLLSNLAILQENYGKPLLVVGTGSNILGGVEMSSGPALYKKNYHDNELTGAKFPFGIFAGMVNVLPGVPIYQTMDTWDECVEYLNRRSIKKEQVTKNNSTFHVFTNNETPQAVGRDEQIYLLILMRKSIENLFIYHIDLGDLTIPKEETIDIPFHEARLAEYKLAIGITEGGKRRKTYRRKRTHRRTRKH
jgi:hypothetical protein